MSKLRSLPLIKVVVMSYKLILLVVSKLMGPSCPKVEVLASQLIGPLGLGMCWVLKVLRSSTTCIVETLVCVGRILILSSYYFYLAHLSLSLASILMFSFICTWITFIGVVFFSSLLEGNGLGLLLPNSSYKHYC